MERQSPLETLRMQAEVIAREIFGPDAYIKIVTQTDPETGETDPVLETHYGFGHSADVNVVVERHFAYHDAFIDRIPDELLSEISEALGFSSIPTDLVEG